MKATGIVRRIDDLGRVVIPKEIRRTMRIREGDPLEIYTDTDGQVIFKKYSPMGELSEFAAQICDALHKTTGSIAAVCDRVPPAMMGLSEAVNTALADIEAGSWADIAASNGNFGLEDGDYIGLPTADDSWNFETFTTEEYEEVKDKIKNGEITVDNSSDDATKPTVSEFTTVNYIQ